MTVGLNPLLEDIHPDNGVVARRQARGFPPLKPPLDHYTAYLHLEMWLSYLKGLDHAAVVTACALLESTLKSALYLLHHAKAEFAFDRVAWDSIDELEFGRAASMAKSKGLVTKEEWQQLEWFREHIRNDYMHGATPKWLKDKPADDFVQAELETGEVKEAEGTLGDHFVPQRIARVAADRNACNEVVPAADRLVRIISANALANVEQYKREHPSSATVKQLEQVLENIQKQGMDVNTLIMSDIPKVIPERCP